MIFEVVVSCRPPHCGHLPRACTGALSSGVGFLICPSFRGGHGRPLGFRRVEDLCDGVRRWTASPRNDRNDDAADSGDREKREGGEGDETHETPSERQHPWTARIGRAGRIPALDTWL